MKRRVVTDAEWLRWPTSSQGWGLGARRNSRKTNN